MYQALYRKWRPKTFDDVVGQSHITQTLKNQVSTGRLSHAYLFIGTRGTGKTTCAKILAKAVNCEHPENGNPCNKCPACLGIEDGSIMDVVEMDAASNNGVDNVRALRDEAVFSPAAVKKRVYIIDEVHMLSASAFNALLKILEEPPEHLMFILATTELQKVPATILSRCQRHSFKRLDIASICARLSFVAEQERIALTDDGAALIARLSDGGMRDALSLLDQCAGREKVDVDTIYSAMGLAGKQSVAQLLNYIAEHRTADALTLFSRLWSEGKDPATLLGELCALERDVLLCLVAPGGSAELLSGGYDDKTLRELGARFSAPRLIDDISSIQSTLTAMRGGQARTLCELCLITLCEPQLGGDLQALGERVDRLETLVSDGVQHSVSPSDIPTGAPAVSVAAPVASVAAPAVQRPEPLQTEQVKHTPPSPVQAQETHSERAIFDETDLEFSPPFTDADAPADASAPPFDTSVPPFATSAPPSSSCLPGAESTQPSSDGTDLSGSPAPSPSQESAAMADVTPVPVQAGSGVENVQLGGQSWYTLIASAALPIPAGIRGLLSDPSQTLVSVDGDTVHLRVHEGFPQRNINRPDTLALLQNALSQATGHSLHITVGTIEDAVVNGKDASPKASLDDLSKFDIVSFK